MVEALAALDAKKEGEKAAALNALRNSMQKVVDDALAEKEEYLALYSKVKSIVRYNVIHRESWVIRESYQGNNVKGMISSIIMLLCRRINCVKLSTINSLKFKETFESFVVFVLSLKWKEDLGKISM